ncbi:MAG: FG-GAP-like repeat-containing protein, partial [Acidobacteriota bacterium]|nr:FG-GAP-like repeat-containing protein [Acidobacteriota bacterium]MDQ4123045.1 FG-GAP-like repeat-containing protein [Acidobacteriota bacterium]
MRKTSRPLAKTAFRSRTIITSTIVAALLLTFSISGAQAAEFSFFESVKSFLGLQSPAPANNSQIAEKKGTDIEEIQNDSENILQPDLNFNLSGSNETAITSPSSVTTVFSDDFSTNTNAAYTTNGAIGASAWTVTRSGGDWGARRNTSPAQLELTNDASATANADGWALASTPSSSFSSPYNTTLSSNTGLVTWTFNMRQPRSDPAGFSAAASYGVAFILAGTSNTNNNTGNGYAVVLGQSGATDPIRLAKYSGGIQSTLTNIITSNTTGLADFGTEYLSIKVTYNPASNTWELFLRNDGTTAFADPAAGTLTSQGTAVDNTNTGTSLPLMGAYWQGSTGTTQTAFFDNTTVTVGQPVITTSTSGTLDFGSVEVGSTSAEQNYTVSGSDLISNITVTAPTDFEVSKTSGSGFASSVSLTQSSGTVSSTTIYVRFKPTSVGTKSGNITNVSTGATTQNVSITGIGTDTTPPDTSITPPVPTNPSNSTSATFQFTGTDNVGVTGFECSLDNASFTACSTGINYTGLSDGSHTFQVRAKDAAGNVDASQASYTWTIDATAPTVSSINRASTDPTAPGSSVDFTVTFSENVTGVDSGDFALTPTGGVTGANITNVAGSNSIYTVTVNTGSGTGTLRLDVTDDDSIADATGNKLGGTGAGNGNFTTGQTYTIPPPPALGNYGNTTINLSGNTTITPDAAPTNATYATAATTSNFKGNLEVDPATGVVRVTNAFPANLANETYPVTVAAYNAGGVTTKTFNLTVQAPSGCNGFGTTAFAPAVNFPIGAAPTSAAVGDFNGDGKQDIVASNQSSNNVSVLLRNATNDGFDPAVNFAVSTTPYSVAVGDFNGDGKQDIVAANGFANNVSVLLRNAANDGFDPAVNSSAGHRPIVVTVGDFNGDGKLDIATSNLLSHNVSILLRNAANNGFDPAVNSPVGTNPYSVAVGDFNNDGKLDIATANGGSANVSILLRNAANNGFDPAVNSPVGTNPQSVAVGDFNNDGKPDVATANYGSDNVSVLLRNAANNGFDPAVNFAVGTNPKSVAAGDFNNDGKQDIVAANVTSKDISVLLRKTTDDGFDSAVNFPFSSNPTTAAIADFNGDNRQDIFTALSNNNASVLQRVCNAPPSITPATGLTREKGAAGTNSQIATVSDVETAAGSLTVTATTVPTGITVSNIVNTNGTITADIAAAANAATGNNTVVLTVSDGIESTNANLTVTVTAAPEINVKGNNVSIADGDTTPDAADHTDFGTVSIGSSLERTFTIENTGNDTLTVGNVSIAVGLAEGGFTVTQQPGSSVAPNGSTTFKIKYAPTTTGLYSTGVLFTNNDGDENPFDFVIQGTGTDTTPPTVFSINRASADPTTPGSLVNFTVTFTENVTGVDAADFAPVMTGGVSGASVTNVTGSDSTYTVTVNTGSGGGTLRLDVVDNDSIVDGAGNPLGGTGAGNGNFTTGQVYTISGTPEIVVKGNNVVITKNDYQPSLADHTDFGVIPVGGIVERTFTIENTGSGTLTIGNVGIAVGLAEMPFTVTQQPASTVAPNDSTTFKIQYAPTTAGAYSTGVSFSNNDSDENPFDFAIVGRTVPHTVYVDEDWAAVAAGTDPDGAGPATEMGYDAFAAVQPGVDAVAAGGNVSVLSGIYHEDVTINKQINLLGAGADVTTISGAIGGSATTIFVAANNVTIKGFTITRDGNTAAQWGGDLNLTGIAPAQGTTGMLVYENVFTGNRTAIDINNSSGHTIRNNVIDFNRTGILFRNTTENMTVVENFITNNWTVGVLFLDGSGGTNAPIQSAAGSVFSNNNISGNWYGQVGDRQTGASLPAPGASPKNLRGNWWGTTTPVVTTNNTTEPGYAAQIPIAYGGTATAPGGQPDIAGPASANIIYLPLLTSGTDTDVETVPGRGTFGFQGVTNNSTVVVRQNSLQGWQQQNTGGATQSFIVGPGTPPLGVGSLQLSVGANGNDAAQIRNPQYHGTRLDSLTSLSYSTYVQQDGAGGGQVPYIILHVDHDNDPGTAADLLFFEPVYQGSTFFPSNPQGPPTAGTWQNWNALTGGWWSVNGYAEAGPGTSVKTLAQYVAAFPNARIVNTGSGAGGLRIVTGFGAPAWNNFVGNVDKVQIGVANSTTQYDFEPLPTLSINDVTLNEGNSGTTNFNFTVTLSQPSDQVVTVDYATADSTASSPSDFTSIPTTQLTFNPGETSKQITVQVNGDTAVEANEDFFVNLSTPSAATIQDNQGAGTITNDDFSQPTISKAFTPDTIQRGGQSTITLTLSNSNSSLALTNASFTD